MDLGKHRSASRRHIGWSLLAVGGLTLFYLVTAPDYHSTAIDSYHFAHVITEEPIFSAGLRLYLWLTSMQALFALVSSLVADPDPFIVVGVANALQTAVAVLLLRRLLWREFGVPRLAATLTAGLFAVSYGTWRYATELEVYASAALLGLLLLAAAFAADFERQDGRWKPLLALAALGATATLFYQPLGIVAGFAIPAYLALRFSARLALAYYAASGTILATGLGLVHLLKFRGEPFDIQQVLDSDGKLPSLPSLAECAHAVVAALQNLLSINWVFAFGPTRAIVEWGYSARFGRELIAAETPHAELLFLLTVPAAAVILIATRRRLRAQAGRRPISPQEAAALVWLGLHAVLCLALDPSGFEAWLPALVPIMLLLGSRVTGPLVERGSSVLVASMLGVFLVHNWFAGVAVFAWSGHDYNEDRGEAILSRATRGDLVVVGGWPLERYLNYMGKAETLLATPDNISEIPAKAASVLSSGGRVFLYDEVLTPSPETVVSSPGAQEADRGLETLVARGTRLDLARGYAVVIAPDTR